MLDYDFIQKIKDLDFVEKVLLFGSRAKGTHQERSDIDVAVICPKATFDQWQHVQDIVDEADTLLTIDVVRFDTLSDDSELRAEIVKSGVEL